MHLRQLRGWLVRLFGLFHRKQREREFAKELESHLVFHIEDNLRTGMSPEEARRRALVKLGGVTLTQELHREQRGLPMLETLIQDLRYGVRMLRKHKGFTVVAVLTLALGIGANTAIFSVVNAVWLRSLPYPEAEQLTLVWHRNTKRGDDSFLASGNYLDLLRRNQSFAQMAAISDNDFSLTGSGEPERLQGQAVSASLFRLLKVAPTFGRDFTEADDRVGATRVVILSHGLWERRFGGQADVIGQTLTLNELPYTVVGVMPPGFVVPEGNAELWTPIAFSAEAANNRAALYLSALARLKSGVTLEQAQSEADVIARNLEMAYPQSNTELGFSIVSLHGFMVRDFKQALWVLLTMNIVMAQARARDLTSITNFYQQVVERVQALPGVAAASVATVVPIVTSGRRANITLEDKPDPPPGTSYSVNYRVVSPDYFRTLGMPLAAGRWLSAQDNPQTPAVVVINQALARHYWGDETPVGKRFKIGARASNDPWLTVVGVVGDVRQAGLHSESLPELYTPFTQEHRRWVRPRVLFVRTTGDPLGLVAAVKRQIWSVDKDQPINDVRTMEEVVAQSLGPRRFNLLLLSVFAALALVLASVGMYGVISYGVSQRTREIGVRMALGAERRDIFKLIVSQGMWLTLGGVALGLLVSFALTRWLASLLFGVSATDPLTFASVALLLTLVALLACYVPARRATKVNPLIALRHE